MPDALPVALQAALAAHLADRADPAKARQAAAQLAAHGQWLAAAGVLRHLLGLGTAVIDDVVSYVHCLVSGGDLEGTRTLVADVASQGPDGPALRAVARALYGTAALAYAQGRYAEAEAVADLVLPSDPFGRRLLGLAVPEDGLARPASLDDDEVAAFIGRAIAESESGRVSPPGRGPGRAAEEAAFAPHAGRRVLIVHRDRYYPRPDSDRTPAPDYLRESAVEAGLEARVLRSDFACAIPAAVRPAAAAAEEAQLRDAIESWQPDVVVYDAFGGAGREAMTEAVRTLRRRLGFRLVGLFHDVWSDTIRDAIAGAADDLDAVWFFDPVATSPHLRAIRRGVATVPPIPEGPFRAARGRVGRTRDLGFIGSISISNHIRGIWLMEMRRRGIPIEAVTGYPFSAEPYRTIPRFADFLAGCKASLCICGRNSEESAIPGRVWEGIFAGSVLLEDDTLHLRHFLTPFAHYVPFRSIDELAYYAGFLARRDDVRESIAAHALAFVRDSYPATRIWRAVLETAADEAAAPVAAVADG